MDRLKKARRPIRGQATRLMNELKTILDAEDVDTDAVGVKLELLRPLMDELAEKDADVSNRMLDDDVEEAEQATEYEEVFRYRETYTSIRMRAEKVLFPVVNPEMPATEVDRQSVKSTTETTGNATRRFKLKEVDLMKFDGELKHWLCWWSQFSKIHEDDELHASNKLQYLRCGMVPGTEPAEIVESYMCTNNYEKAIETLQERYGRDDLLLQFYVRELLKLVINKGSKEKELPLSSLYLKLESHLRSLLALKFNQADPTMWLFPLVESCLSKDKLEAWQRSEYSKKDGSKEIPPVTRLDYLMEFIKMEVRCEQQILLAETGFGDHVEKPTTKTSRDKSSKAKKEEISTIAGLTTGEAEGCAFCGKNHESDRCVSAMSMKVEKRRQIVKEKRLCFRCLKKNHISKKCRAMVKCVMCGGQHYPILCNESNRKDEEPAGHSGASGSSSRQHTQNRSTTPSEEAPQRTAQTSSNCSTEILLNTIWVTVNGGGKSARVRLVGDSCSQRSYIRTSALNKIGRERVGTEWLQNVVFTRKTTKVEKLGRYLITLQHATGSQVERMELLEREELCGGLPRTPNGPWLKELADQGIELNDVGSGCADVDILIGNDMWGRILTTTPIIKLDRDLYAQETVFGWTLGGRLPKYSSSFATTINMSISMTTDLSNLWNLEAMGISDPIEVKSKEDFEKEALDYFNGSVDQDDNGRYVVALPWKRDSLDLPSNRMVAEKRLRRETHKLKKMGKWDVYDKVMKDWREEGLTTIVDDNDEGHYLPHRPVFKNSSSTPVRPVFDASCRTVNKLSLNDYLHKGPNYLELIPTLLLKLRENKVGVTADIRKAFQMLRVRDEDKKFQKFLWWEDESCTKMIVYQHERVVFGMVCSPFLLAATIMHHLNKNKLETVTVPRLKTSYYVDNCVTSVTSMEEFWNFKDEASVVMREAGMELRQWAYAPFKIEACNDGDPTLEKDPCLMVLGLCWNREVDHLSCEVKDAVIAGDISKRVVLSVVSKIFDPLGILCPTTLQMKQILQEAWSKDFGWDDPLPETTCKKVIAWMEESRLLRKMSVPRHFQCEFPVEREVHCFADASGISFACVLFMRTKSSSGLVSVKFLIAKSRLAPFKKNTIPRLELMACLLSVRMWKLVCSSIDMAGVRTRFWTDSTTALSWIQRNEEYGVFVNNRVTEIRTLTKMDQWAHVPGAHNPADLPSRGCSPSQLMKNLEWIEGPAWLKLEPDMWPSSTEKADEEEIRREFKKIASCSSLIPEKIEPRFGSYERLVRVWVYVSRFLNIRNGKSDRKGGITIMEMRQAEKLMLKQVQQACFPEKSNVIGGIHVKVDGDGLLRVVTKLDYREDSDDFISPILMPKRHPYTDLLIMSFHRMNKHVGPQTLMASLRQKYWIIQTRRTVRRVLRKCAVCRRYNAKSFEVPVAPLPEKRVMDAEPFQTTGVDLAGPLFLRDGTKTWIVLFTCAVYRCVYLELVTSCSSEAFLGALERFVGIYGRPNTIFSDNGLNFVGSDNLFRQLDWESIERENQVKRINWSFNPPTAAWWGGFWERLIRDVKNLLKRNIGRSRLDIDQLRTLLFGVASIINDRPLTVMTEDDSDMVPLTPAMFIRARAIGHLPETETAEGLSASYRHMKKIQAQLQTRFRKEYLSMLVQRGNERKEKDLAVGDVVLVGADNKKRFEWPLGRVEKLIPGTDGKIRVAVVKTASGVFTRPLQRLYPLEVTRTEAFPQPAATERKTEKASHEQVLGKTKSGRLVIRPSRYGSCVSFSLKF